METPDGFLRGEDGSYFELLLSWLAPEEAKRFKRQLNSRLKRWRFRRLSGEAKIIEAVEATCRKLHPELKVSLSAEGLRLDSYEPRGRMWYSGDEFRVLLTERSGSHEDFIMAKIAYGGASRNPGLELRYEGGPSRVGRVRSLHSWGMKVDTPQGVRHFRWDRITGARVLMSDERTPPRRLEFLSMNGIFEATWAYDFSTGDDPLERYK